MGAPFGVHANHGHYGTAAFLNYSSMTTIQERYVQHVETSVARARLLQSKLLPFQLEIDGMSSYKNRHLLNNLMSLQLEGRKLRYLEVGSWKGSTFCASIFNNDIEATSIENFSEFTSTSFIGEYVHPREAFHRNLNTTVTLSNPRPIVITVQRDSFATDPTSLGAPFDVYFYDGEHSYDSHVKAYTHFHPCLADTFITLVDDYQEKPGNPPFEATKHAFDRLGFSVIKSWYLFEETHDTVQGAMAGWWNGLYVAVVQKPSTL